MTRGEGVAAVAAPLMAECLTHLCAVAASITTGMTIEALDTFPCMAACYLEKQIEHARGILLLGAHPDARLVARAMLEGFWQLSWASQDQDVRAHRWMTFAYVCDWRTIQHREARGDEVPANERAVVAEGLAQFGPQFLRRKPRAVPLANGTTMMDPYSSSWHGKSVGELAREAHDESEYVRAYALFSDRGHWDTAEAGRSLDLAHGKVLFSGASPEGWASALHIGFEYLFRTAMLVDTTLSRDRSGALEDVIQRYAARGREAGLNMTTPVEPPIGG